MISANIFKLFPSFRLIEPRWEFVSPLKSQKVNEKEHACLECDVNDKDAIVEWFHDNQKLKVIATGFLRWLNGQNWFFMALIDWWKEVWRTESRP